MDNKMEKNLINVSSYDQIEMELPPGFRFHPTDEELITHYLSKKVLDNNFCCEVIGEVDMNKIEPWDLPWRAKLGESEWYFFSLKDKKYPAGRRTNRATAHGYWKATGKDKEILKGNVLVGMKKTLVFYKGRAPNGAKSNWITHEYRLEGNFSCNNFPRQNKIDWVINKVFLKTSGGLKVHISEITRMDLGNVELPPTPFHPLIDQLPAIESEVKQVNNMSNSIDVPHHSDQNKVTCLSNSIFQPSDSFDTIANQLQYQSEIGYPFSSSILNQDPPVFRSLIENNGQDINDSLRNQREMVSLSQEIGVNTEKSPALLNLEMEKRSEEEAPSTSLCVEDFEIWDMENYFE